MIDLKHLKDQKVLTPTTSIFLIEQLSVPNSTQFVLKSEHL